MNEPVIAESPGPDSRTARLYALVALALVVANLLELGERPRADVPARLTLGFHPPPKDYFTPPWRYTTGQELFDGDFLDGLADRLSKRGNTKKSKFEQYRGEALMAIGDYVEAELRFQQAVALDPEDVEPRQRLLESLVAEKKWEQAQSVADALRELGGHPETVDARFERGGSR